MSNVKVLNISSDKCNVPIKRTNRRMNLYQITFKVFCARHFLFTYLPVQILSIFLQDELFWLDNFMVGTLSFSFGSNEEKKTCKNFQFILAERDIVKILVHFHFYRVSHIEMVKMKWLSILSTAKTNLLSTLYYDLELVPAFYNPPLTFITQQLFLFCSLINQQETRGFI